ncbi:hypothetical protein ILYODFUR_037502 [Ilyodon furcidens]|uniref:Uncharacterized protein n=1 Tax=Ilyodon furcidens TaxID=33524 RepID=A0ABV0V9C5_9TELE
MQICIIFLRVRHLHTTFCPQPLIMGRGEAGTYLKQATGKRRVHPGKVASPSQGNTQTTMHTLIHTPKGNLDRPINLTGMSLDCGRKPEYMVRTHTTTGRTRKLHAERPHPGRESNQGLLAARQQCYHLHHCAALISETLN